MKNWNLENKKALITGGTKGIGRACLQTFLELGAEVVFTARTEGEIKALETELRNAGYARVWGLRADLAEAADREHMRAWIEREWGSLDVLVNNAGINLRKATVAYSPEEYMRIFQINLISQFELSIALYPFLKNSGHASVINIASVAGLFDVRTGSPYGISKAGLIQMTRNLAVEWAPDGIRVNSVSPWYAETPLTQPVLENKERLDAILQRTPMGRVAQAEEMASVVAFFAMDHASYLTGQNLTVDGGLTAGAL
jgi:Tropinone reductase 1